jgi:hypothetical protein
LSRDDRYVDIDDPKLASSGPYPEHRCFNPRFTA